MSNTDKNSTTIAYGGYTVDIKPRNSFSVTKTYRQGVSYGGGQEYRREIRSSNVTPFYRTWWNGKVSRGPLPDNKYTYSLDKRTPWTGYTETWSTNYAGQPKKDYSTPWDLLTGSQHQTFGYGTVGENPFSASEMTSLDATVRSALLLKIKNQKINLAQTFAEREQLKNLFLSTAKSIASSMAALKRLDYKGAAEALGVKPGKRASKRFRDGTVSKGRTRVQAEAIASGWLALQYGWKPLLNDLFGAVETVVDANFTKVRVHQTSATKTIRRNSNKNTSDGNRKLHDETDSKYQITYRVRYIIENPQSQTLAQLGLTNPAVLAWELLPFSFVADWFLPIGNYLASLDATIGLRFSGGGVTRFQRHVGFRTVIVNNHPAVGFHEDSFWSTARTVVELTRNPLVDFPYAALPQFKNGISALHLANAAALLQSVFKGKRFETAIGWTKTS